MKKKELRVALVHDYLRTFGGGERVLLALIDLFPKADIFVASANFENDDISHYFLKHKNKLKTTWIQSVRLFRIKPIVYRLFVTQVWRSFDFSNYDLVISSSGSNMAFCINVPDGIPHICYCHTPPKFLLNNSNTESGFQNNPIISFLIRPYLLLLKLVVKNSAQRVTLFIANSQYIRLKIQQYLKKDALVIYPPLMLECANLTTNKKNNESYLIVSRLEKNKNLELIIKAFNKSRKKLIIVGKGRQYSYLKRLSNNNIIFIGFVPDNLLRNLYETSRALVVAAQDEDFGISVIESLSQGTPVIAPYQGGFRESIVSGITGFFYHKDTVEALNRAINRFERSTFDSKKCVEFASTYHKNKFNEKMGRLIDKVMNVV